MSYNYASLSTAISTWATRTYTGAQTDEFIMLAESAINRKLRGYERETTSPLALVAGIGTLPADFIRMVSVSYSTYGTLSQVTPDAITALNPAGQSDLPAEYAISGTTIKTAFLVTDNVNITYMAKLLGLSAGNPSNWLLALAPDAYLFMCKAMQRAFEEEWDASQGFQAQAEKIIDELNLQSDVAQYGRARLVINGSTP